MNTALGQDTEQELGVYCRATAQAAQAASRKLVRVSGAQKNAWLVACADALVAQLDMILEANELDLRAASDFGLTDAATDRLRLDDKRLAGMAQALREIAALPDPIHETISGSRRPNGLEIRKVRVPLGTVFFIYESRPNVTVDAGAICVKSGNAVILRGGKEARHSSAALVKIMTDLAPKFGLPSEAIQLVATMDREAVGHFLALPEFIDVAIPRGGRGLIERVASEAQMPVIKHFDGNCHVYVDATADPQMALDIVVNSKCQRMGVCNACESILVHESVAKSWLPQLAERLSEFNVEIRGDERCCQVLAHCTLATEEDWSQEYLGPILSVHIVADLDEAIEWINRYGSHHTDAIVTRELKAADRFVAEVDSAAVIVNASTRFNDGGEFGLGAEIGISTDKFHARGPCGLRELTTYKYIVSGSGQVR